ncbi:hypothetical protein BJY00DRAFT_291069 [Aspergillus carlsbadensis]|nr:hypothetical protein BJY00DRAFT_291069 [Aspergillus carlsbadensis]
MSDSEASSGPQLGPPSIEPGTTEELCDALRGEDGVKLTAEFWTRNKGKLDTPHKGRTALSLAAQRKDLEIVKMLLDHGVNVNEKDAKVAGGRTALSYAAQLLDEYMIKLLLERGARPNQGDDLERTPLSWVASANQGQGSPKQHSRGWAAPSTTMEKCLDLLKEYKAEPHQKDKGKRTPLSWAAEKGSVEMVRYLCKKGGTGDGFEPDEKGRSPLSYAAEKQQYSVIATILGYKRNYQDCDKQHQTPLHWLYQPFHDKGAYQADPRRTKAMDDILTYLGFATQRGGFAGSQFKDRHHTSPNILNRSVEDQKTLLAYAVLNNYEELIRALWARETNTSPNVPNDDDKKTALLLALEQATVGDKKFIKHPLFRDHIQNALPAVIKLGSPPMLECLLCEFSKDTNELTRVADKALWRVFNDASNDVVVALLQRLFEVVLDAGAVELMEKLKSQKTRLELALEKRPNARDLVQVLLENGMNPRIWTRSEDWFERLSTPTECLVKLCRKNKEAERSSFALEFAGKAPKQAVPGDSEVISMSHKTEDSWGATKFLIPEKYAVHEIQLDFRGLKKKNPCGEKGIEPPTWGIRWMMKPGAEQPVMYESTLRKVWIPDDITDFLTQFLHEFDEKWQAYCDTTNGHLDKHRRNTSLDEERTDGKPLIELAGDIYYLSALRGTLQAQVRRIQNGIEEAFENQDESFRKLQYQLREYKAIYNEHLDRYEHVVNTLLQLEYAHLSAQEAGRVRRITSITFIYLPLMFVASLFGMNIDILKDNPGWYWYLILAVTTLGANQIIHQYLQEPDDGRWHKLLINVRLQKRRPVESSA